MAFSRHALLGAALLLLPIVTGSPVAREGELRLASHAARQLQIRAPGDSEQEPIEAEFDVSGWPLSAEFNCYIMLCVMDGRRVFQRIEDGSERRTHYTRSGAYFTPFRDDQHLSQRNAVRYDDTAVSAEEFPWESMGQGGTGAHLFPTTAAEQEAQGRAISSRFSRSRDVTPIDRGNWFRVSFANFERGGYCEALHSNPPNFDICHQHITLTFGEHPEVYVPDFDQIMDPATHKLYLFGGGSGGSVKREEGSTKVAVPRGYEVPLPRAHGFEKRQAVPPEDLSQYEGSDMCVDLPDLRNTCDEDLLAASE